MVLIAAVSMEGVCAQGEREEVLLQREDGAVPVDHAGRVQEYDLFFLHMH